MVSFYVCRCSCFTRICRKETSSWTNIRSKSSGELREYSRTSRKRPPKMQRLCSRLRQDNHRGSPAMHMCRAVQFHLVTKVLRIFLSNIVHTANIELRSDLNGKLLYRQPKEWLRSRTRGVRVRVYERFIYLLIYLFYFIFNSGPVPRAWHTDPRPLLFWA